jgi:hypothetical protein
LVIPTGGFVEVEVYEGEEMILNMGPQHPSTHGVLRLELQTDGEVVEKIMGTSIAASKSMPRMWIIPG